MSYLAKYVVNEAIRYFREQVDPQYQSLRAENGFRYDSLLRRGGSPGRPDVSILARVGMAYLWFGVAANNTAWKDEARAALADLLFLQRSDGRWERGVGSEEATLDEAFDTADAVQFCMHCTGYVDGELLQQAKTAAISGVRWLTEGQVAPMSGVTPGPPLYGLMSFENANHVGSIIRAVTLVGGSWLDYALEGAQALGSWQLPCGSWSWYKGADKVTAAYHDLTMAGLCETYSATKDKRLRSHIELGVDFVQSMILSSGFMALEWTANGPSPFFHYSGLMTASMAYDCTSDAAVRELATGLALVLTQRRFPTGSYVYAVEGRLVIVRGLAEFVRVFGTKTA